MSIIYISDIYNGYVTTNSEVTVRGWIRTRRDSKSGISFLAIYDGSCFNSIQIIANRSLSNYKSDILRLTTGCSVVINGRLVVSQGRSQSLEILATKIEVIGWVNDPNTYPITAKYHSTEYLREVAHLRPRTNLIGAVSRIRHTLAQILHSFFNERGYFWVTTPIITTLDTEGTSKMFRVSTLDMENLPYNSEKKINYSKDFFGKESFLTVSGQLNGEAYACALSKIYTFGPTFRAENSNTSRHLAEFWMLEPEVAFANLDDIIILAEKMLKYVFENILKKSSDDMQFFAKKTNSKVIARLENLISANFTQIEYTDAISILEKSNYNFNNPIYWGIDLASEHERYLVEECFRSPIIIKNHPKTIKAFYMRLNDDEKTVASMDVLIPEIGEIIGGSQREERLEILDARMENMNINKKDYWWYRDLRRYGTVPHSGFGMGFERLISYITNVKNVRDVIPFPRVSRNAMF